MLENANALEEDDEPEPDEELTEGIAKVHEDTKELEDDVRNLMVNFQSLIRSRNMK